MKLIERLWKSVTYFVSTFSLSDVPVQHAQAPILVDSVMPMATPTPPGQFPKFPPPGRWESEFVCKYPAMKGWEYCGGPGNRECWIRETAGTGEFNIDTRFELVSPEGITRYYELDIVDGKYNGDGMIMPDAKLVRNASSDRPADYPGPWIEACWGDTLVVKVNNKMKHNGTTIHWHGIRQNFTMMADGVPGLTQCPIAPGDSFNYTFKADQYGSSWYHSHYSLQYADGVLGPLTIYGPSTADFDEHRYPIMMTDWLHNSAYEALMGPRKNLTILLNGAGNITQFNSTWTNSSEIPEPYEVQFDGHSNKKGQRKKYLLQLINTGFDSTFVFSIDGHKLQVVAMDFVPIVPYTNSSILIGIGQRYHVIVEAASVSDIVKNKGAFWIRTYIARDCPRSSTGTDGYEMTGILKYGEKITGRPHSEPWHDVALTCSDERYLNLVPRVPWTIGPPANGPIDSLGESFDIRFAYLTTSLFPTAAFSIGGPGFRPLRLDYGDPLILHMDKVGPWRNQWVVTEANYTKDDWIYFAIRTDRRDSGGSEAHPIHLHGHDFAILQTAEDTPFADWNLNLNVHNPPRRDVVLVPNRGFSIIAFRADNPGPWIMHCHIANHASFGLAMSIFERQTCANNKWGPKSEEVTEARRVCHNWNEWQSNCTNWWAPTYPNGTRINPNGTCAGGQFEFHDDSGI